MFKNVKRRKRMSSFMVVMLLITMLEGVFPALVRADSDLGSGSNFITSVKLEIKEGGTWSVVDAAYPVPQNTDVRLTYDWEISGSIINTIENGSYFTVDIPDGIKVVNTPNGIDRWIKDGDTDVVQINMALLEGTPSELKIKFYDRIPKNDDGSQKYTTITGSAGFETKFEFKSVPTTNPVVLSFPIKDDFSYTIPVKFSPSGVSSGASKSGVPNKAYNSDKITWTLDVNKTLDYMDSAGITDEFGTGLSYVPGSLKVYDLTVKPDGSTSAGALLADESTVTFTTTTSPAGFILDLGSISGARRITYETKIENKVSTSFSNTARYSGIKKSSGGQSSSVNINNINASVTANRGSLLAKAGQAKRSFNPGSVTWSVYVNKAERELTGVSVTDSIPGGLSLDTGSIEVYALDIDDSNGNATVSGGAIAPSNYTVTTTPEVGATKATLTVELPDNMVVGKAYEIRYKTDISGDPAVSNPNQAEKVQNTFSNSARLSYTENGASTTGSAVSANVSINRGVPLYKNGTVIINYSDKYIDWYVDVNTGMKAIGSAVVSDTIGSYQSLVPGSVKVYNLSINTGSTNGTKTQQDEITPQAINYIPNSTTPTAFNVELGNISSAYRIRYRTNITDVNQSQFQNEAILTGSGITTGQRATRTLNQAINNTVTKATVNSVNYAAKTMEWRLTVDPLKEPMKDMVIEDTFPQGGLVLLPETVSITGAATLYSPADYTLVSRMQKGDGSDDWSKGFIINFTNPVKDHTYTITYKTAFDRLIHTTPSAVGFKNSAMFNWNEDTRGAQSQTREATWEISANAAQNGYKECVNFRKTDREIDWAINLNYLSEPLTALAVEDTIEGNQKLKTDSLKVYRYSVASGGTITGKTEITSGFDIVATEGGFTITFDPDVDGTGDASPADEINRPYRIEYTTAFTGQSQNVYVNNASVKETARGMTQVEKVFSASTTFSDYNSFVSKMGTRRGDFHIDWTIDFNKSLSAITDATIVDTLSTGHLYMTGPDDFKVYKVTGSTEELVDNSEDADGREYNLQYTTNPLSGMQSFILKFLKTITSQYRIKYTTEITATQDVNLTNSAAASGSAITVSTQPGTATIAFYFSSLSAEAKATQANKMRSLKVIKVDANDSSVKLPGAVFQIIDSSGVPVGSYTTGGDGTFTVSLKKESYTLKEITPPTGYQISEGERTIGANDTQITVTNQPLRTLTITKLDAEDDSPLTGAAFRITGGPAGHEVDVTTGLTDSSGKATVSGLYFGNYIVSEVTTPGNYNPPVVNSFTVDLNSLSGLDSGLTVKNYKYGQITLHKKDAQDNTPLAGAVFAVIKEGTEVGTIDTDGTGTGTLGNLPFGTYSIVERTAPAGYMLDTATTVDVTLSPGSTSGSETLTDYKLRNLTIKKVDGANNTTPLAGAKFRIEGPAGFTPVETAATDASGITTVSGLSFGTYQITEITAPPGYYLNTSPASITLDKTDDSGNPPLTYSLTMTNARIPSGGGGGGGGGTAPEPPKPPVVPPVEPPVQPGQPQQPEQPKPPEQKETTTENTPVDGNITVPEGEIPTVGQPPQNGKVEVDEKGNWTYTPDPGFKGKDNFTIKVKDQDGNDKEILIEVDVNEIPQGAAKTLPKTGEQGRMGFYGAGLLLILAGFLLWRRRMA